MNKKHVTALALVALFTFILVTVGSNASGGGFGNSPDSNQLTGDGFYQGFSPKNGTTHFTEVNEVTCNGRTDVVSASTVGARDSYMVNIAHVPIGALITGIDVGLCASGEKNPKKSVAQLKTFYRLNGTDSADHDAPAITGNVPTVLAPTTMVANVVRTSETALEVGVLYASGTETAQLSQVTVSVSYVMLVKPGQVSIEEPSPQSLRLRWEDQSTVEDGYVIERSQDGVAYKEIARTSAGATEYIDSGLLPSTTYYYRVRAFNLGGYSEESVASKMTSLLRPATPVKLGVVPRGPSTLFLEWGDESTSEEGYWVQRSLDGFNFTNIEQLGKDATEYTGAGLTPGTTYYFRVYAYNADWISEFSNIASGVPTE